HRGIAAGIVGAGARDIRIVGELGDAGQKAVGQRVRPALAAIEGGAHRASIVVIPVVGTGNQVVGVAGISGYGGFVLGSLVLAYVNRFDLGSGEGRPHRQQ